MSLGDTIRITRQKALFTQKDFAHKLNVALSTVNRWELNKVQRAMGIEVTHLICLRRSAFSPS